MKRIFLLMPCFLLAACNNAGQYQQEIHAADQQCDDIVRAAYPDGATAADIAKGVYSPKRGKLGVIADCTTEKERPVVVKYSPSLLDIYDAYRAKIAAASEDYDKGEISYKQYLADMKQEKVDLRDEIHARNSAIDDDNQKTSDAIGSIANSLSQIMQARSGR